MFGKPDYRALPDHLFHGDGTGHFTETTEASGMKVPSRQAVGVAFCDFDDSGCVDIYVANYRLQPNVPWINQLHFGLGARRVKRITVRIPGVKPVNFRRSPGWRSESLLVDVSRKGRRRPRRVPSVRTGR